MALFKIGTQVETPEAVVSVDVSTDAPIAAGLHHFQLIVVDEEGNQSDAATATVIVRDSIKPTAVLLIEPTQVEPGQAFRLNGSRSSDVAPGKIVKFVWTMID